MRIVHVTDCYGPRIGGIERQVGDLAARQAAAGHEVEVITSVGARSDTGPVHVHRPAPSGRPGRIRYLRTGDGLRTLGSHPVDQVHVHLSTFSPLAMLALNRARRAGIPTAATVHSMWAHATPALRAWAVAAGWSRSAIAWSAVSRAASASLGSVLRGAHVSVIPNGIDPGEWRVDHPAPGEPRRVVVATVMRLVGRKRPRDFARTLAGVRAAVPHDVAITALIVGDGPLKKRLGADLERRGIASFTHLTGALTRDDIRRLYRDVDIYAAPALLESFGIAALEARTAGLPVVAFGRTGIADFVQDGREGLLADDDDGMIDAIRRLILDTDLRSRIAAHNRATPPAMAWPSVVHRHDQLYARSRDLVRARPTRLAPLRAVP